MLHATGKDSTWSTGKSNTQLSYIPHTYLGVGDQADDLAVFDHLGEVALNRGFALVRSPSLAGSGESLLLRLAPGSSRERWTEQAPPEHDDTENSNSSAMPRWLACWAEFDFYQNGKANVRTRCEFFTKKSGTVHNIQKKDFHTSGVYIFLHWTRHK